MDTSKKLQKLKEFIASYYELQRKEFSLFFPKSILRALIFAGILMLFFGNEIGFLLNMGFILLLHLFIQRKKRKNQESKEVLIQMDEELTELFSEEWIKEEGKKSGCVFSEEEREAILTFILIACSSEDDLLLFPPESGIREVCTRNGQIKIIFKEKIVILGN